MQIQHKKKPGHSYERFGSRDNMRNYFRMNRERAEQRERDIEEDYDYGENMDFAGILAEVPQQPDGFPHDDDQGQRNE